MSHSIALVNLTDGTVAGHKAGCSDLKRGKHGTKNHADEPWELDVDTKAQAWVSYNSDFLAEDPTGGSSYDIDWAPCTKRVPEGDKATAMAVEEDIEEDELPADDPAWDGRFDDDASDHEKAKVTAKVGRKWTYLFDAEGELIAELRNDHIKAIAEYAAKV